MKKLLISIFLMLSMVVSGLSSLQYTPAVSAQQNKDAKRCDFLGVFIDYKETNKKCLPCPVDSFCTPITGLQIPNCIQEGFSESDCKETRPIFSSMEPAKCPVGTTTKGNTFDVGYISTLIPRGTPIELVDDSVYGPLLKPFLGNFAQNKTMCKTPEFKCPAETPTKQFLDGVFTCVPINTCGQNEEPFFLGGKITGCVEKCKANNQGSTIIVNGKCTPCSANQYLELINGEAKCEDIIIKPSVCPIQGQIPTKIGDLSTCACVVPQIVSADKTKCENPILPCPAPFLGTQPNCTPPIVKPCPANTFGYNEPNCKPCPANGTNDLAVNSSGCVIIVAPCPANYYGENGNLLCTPCPNGGTSLAATKTIAGCVTPVTPAQNNGGGDGFCGGWWAVVCGAVVATTVDCFLTKVLCNKPQPASPTVNKPVTPNTPPAVKDILKVKPIYSTSKTVDTCTSTNEEYVKAIMQDYPADAHVNKGQNYVWVETVAQNGYTTQMSTVRVPGGKTSQVNTFGNATESPELVCLMKRFAKAEGVKFGSAEYMQGLKRVGVLHGLNKKFKLECLNLDNLLIALSNSGYADQTESKITTTKWIISNETQGFSYSQEYNTENEAKAAADSISKTTSKTGSATRVQRRTVKPRPNTKPKPRVTSQLPLLDVLNNMISPVKASAQRVLEDDEGETDISAGVNTNVQNDADVQVANNNGTSESSQEEVGEAVYTLEVTGSDGSYDQCEIDNSCDTCPDYAPNEREIYGGEIVCLTDEDNEYSNEDLDLGSNAKFDPNLSCPDSKPFSYYGECLTEDEYYNGGVSNSNSNEGCTGEFDTLVSTSAGDVFCGTKQESNLSDEAKKKLYFDLFGTGADIVDSAIDCNANANTVWNSYNNTCDAYDENSNTPSTSNEGCTGEFDTLVTTSAGDAFCGTKKESNLSDSAKIELYKSLFGTGADIVDQAYNCNANANTVWNSYNNTCDAYDDDSNSNNESDKQSNKSSSKCTEMDDGSYDDTDGYNYSTLANCEAVN
jgi:hypothetical protein